MTVNELNELSTALLISLGMFLVGVYLVYVMFGAFNMSRKKENDAKAINKYPLRHLVVYPLVVLGVDAVGDITVLTFIQPMAITLIFGATMMIGLVLAYFKADSILTSKLRSEAGEQ